MCCSVLIGRDHSCDIRIVNKEISRKHAEVYVEDGGAGTHGCRVSSEPEHSIHSGRCTLTDELRCASSLLAVWITSMGREPISVNGCAVESPRELCTGDKIEVLLEGRTRVFYFHVSR